MTDEPRPAAYTEQPTVIACDDLAGLRVRTKDRGLVVFVTEDGSPPPDRAPVSAPGPRPGPPRHGQQSQTRHTRRR